MTTTPPLTRRTDPDTSHAAAAGLRIMSGQARVYDALHWLQPATDDELAQALPSMPPGSVAKRRSELCARGLAADTGLRRNTRYGRPAIVWALTTTRERTEP